PPGKEGSNRPPLRSLWGNCCGPWPRPILARTRAPPSHSHGGHNDAIDVCRRRCACWHVSQSAIGKCQNRALVRGDLVRNGECVLGLSVQLVRAMSAECVGWQSWLLQP